MSAERRLADFSFRAADLSQIPSPDLNCSLNLDSGGALIGDRDGGVKSPKIRGGVKILNLRGSLNLALFFRDSIENRQFGGQKSKFSKNNFRGALAFGIPLSRSPT